MMSLETIRDLSREAARRARRLGKSPKVMTAATIALARAGNLEAIAGMPNLGTFKPKGWARVRLDRELGETDETRGVYMGDNDGFGAYFIDRTGWGADYEAALTLKQFLAKVREGYGYAVIEEGQFQVKVGVFKPKPVVAKREAA